jgi:predicted ArsR family transcriptional regulator
MGDEDEEGSRRRTYRLRFGRPSRAWRFVEVNAECALGHIREQVDLVWTEAKDDRTGDGGDGGLKMDLTSSRISFRLPITEVGPPGRDGDCVTRLTELLTTVGYLTPWSSKGDGTQAEGGLAFRLFKECLLDRPTRSWTMRELMAVLDTSKPTLYRHLKKLEALDLLERGLRGESPRSSKAFRIRYGNLSKAWNFTEEHAKQSLRAYRETVEHLEALLEEVR